MGCGSSKPEPEPDVDEVVVDGRPTRSVTRFTVGSRVRLKSGQHANKFGVVIQDDHSEYPFQVRLDDGKVTGWEHENGVVVIAQAQGEAAEILVTIRNMPPRPNC